VNVQKIKPNRIVPDLAVPETPSKTDAEFDEFAGDYRQAQDDYLWLSGETSEYFAEYKVRQLLEWLPQLQNEKLKILDFGCGDGLMTEYVRRYFLYAEIFGADVSAKSVELAAQNFKGIEFSHISTNQLAFAPNSFDLVLSAGVFHHIPEAERQHWAQQLHAVLKPGGICVIFELNPLNPGTQYIFNTHPMEKNAKMLLPWQCKKTFANFTKTRLKFYCFFPRWFKFLRPLERWLSKIPFSALYGCLCYKN
jgi:SAM-dependent methyltransferase